MTSRTVPLCKTPRSGYAPVSRPIPSRPGKRVWNRCSTNGGVARFPGVGSPSLCAPANEKVQLRGLRRAPACLPDYEPPFLVLSRRLRCIGVRGFEPRASCPPDKRANQAAPHPGVTGTVAPEPQTGRDPAERAQVDFGRAPDTPTEADPAPSRDTRNTVPASRLACALCWHDGRGLLTSSREGIVVVPGRSQCTSPRRQHLPWVRSPRST